MVFLIWRLLHWEEGRVSFLMQSSWWRLVQLVIICSIRFDALSDLAVTSLWHLASLPCFKFISQMLGDGHFTLKWQQWFVGRTCLHWTMHFIPCKLYKQELIMVKCSLWCIFLPRVLVWHVLGLSMDAFDKWHYGTLYWGHHCQDWFMIAVCLCTNFHMQEESMKNWWNAELISACLLWSKPSE